MYCGCNPTALSSQIQISQALIRLMERKPYAAISISELCREAGVSRPTFYSLFSSMENVVLFTLRQRACDLPGAASAGASMEQICRAYSVYISRSRDLLKLLVDNDVGYLLYNSIYDSFLCCSGCGTNADQRRQYTANFIAGGITGVVRQYCTTDPPLSADALCQILQQLFGGSWL